MIFFKKKIDFLQPGTAFLSLINRAVYIFKDISNNASMKKLSIAFLYCYLMALALYELLMSRVYRLLKGEEFFVAGKSFGNAS
jgi:hypothetical protein